MKRAKNAFFQSMRLMKITGTPRLFADHLALMKLMIPTWTSHHQPDTDATTTNQRLNWWRLETLGAVQANLVELSSEYLFWHPLTKSIKRLHLRTQMRSLDNTRENWVSCPKISGTMLLGTTRKKSQSIRHHPRSLNPSRNHAQVSSRWGWRCNKPIQAPKVPGSNPLSSHAQQIIFRFENRSKCSFLEERRTLETQIITASQSVVHLGKSTTIRTTFPLVAL